MSLILSILGINLIITIMQIKKLRIRQAKKVV